MRPSLLLLDSYFLDELNFSVDEKFVYDSAKEPTLAAEDLIIEVDQWRHPEQPLKWYFRLSVRLDDKPGKFPYRFSVRVSGFFDVKEECPQGFVEQLALVNAPAMLYASAREVLAMVSGRSAYLSIILPSITFYDPPKRQANEEPKSAKALPGKTPSKARKTALKK